MNQRPLRRRYERPKRQVALIDCDIYISPNASPNDLAKTGAQIFSLTVNAGLGGVEYNAALMQRLFDGTPTPEFIPGTEPELQPITLFIRKDRIDEQSLSEILHNTLTNDSIRDIRINGRSIRITS